LDLFAYENLGGYLFGLGYVFLGIGIGIALISLIEDWSQDLALIILIDIGFEVEFQIFIPLLHFYYSNLDPITSLILKFSTLPLLRVSLIIIHKLNNQGPSSKSLIEFEKIGFILGFEYIIIG